MLLKPSKALRTLLRAMRSNTWANEQRLRRGMACSNCQQEASFWPHLVLLCLDWNDAIELEIVVLLLIIDESGRNLFREVELDLVAREMRRQ